MSRKSMQSNPNGCKEPAQEVVERKASPLPRPNPKLVNGPIIPIPINHKDFGKDKDLKTLLKSLQFKTFSN